MIRCPLCREDFGSLDVSIINSLRYLIKFVFPLTHIIQMCYGIPLEPLYKLFVRCIPNINTLYVSSAPLHCVCYQRQCMAL